MAWEEKNANLIETIAPASRASAPTRKMRSTRPSRIRFRRPTRFQRSSRFHPAPIAIEQRTEDLEGGGGSARNSNARRTWIGRAAAHGF